MLTHGGTVPRSHALALETRDSGEIAVTVLSYGPDDGGEGDYPGGCELSEPIRAGRFLGLLAGKEGVRDSQKTPTHGKEWTRHCWCEAAWEGVRVASELRASKEAGTSLPQLRGSEFLPTTG